MPIACYNFRLHFAKYTSVIPVGKDEARVLSVIGASTCLVASCWLSLRGKHSQLWLLNTHMCVCVLCIYVTHTYTHMYIQVTCWHVVG